MSAPAFHRNAPLPAYAFTPEEIADSVEELDDDAQWAVAVAYLAAVLRNDPRAHRSELPRLQQLIEPLAGEHSDRRELLSLWPRAQDLLHAR